MDDWTALKYNFRDGLLENWWGGRGEWGWRKSEKKGLGLGLGLGLRFFPRKLLIKNKLFLRILAKKITAQGFHLTCPKIILHTYIHTCILGRMYFVERSIHLIEELWLLIITGVQASGVIIDRLLQQSEIVGPHSSGNFNDWPLKLKAGSKIWVVVIWMH